MSDSMRRRATLRDIATHAGVHISTASRVLNGDPRGDVGPAARERVLAAAAELQYRPNPAAKNLRRRRAGAIGLTIPDMTHPSYAQLIRGAFKEAEKRDTVVLITETPDQDAVARIGNLIQNQLIDGLLVATRTEQDSAISAIEGQEVPLVFVNRRAPGRTSVTVADEAGAALAMQAMYDHGHRRVGVISGAPGVDTSQRRLEGFLQKAAELGLAEPMQACGYYTASGGANALTELMSADLPPTAIFASNLMSGIGALSRAAAHGISVPDALSLVVFDDAEIADYTVPALTRIRMPFDEMGEVAVRVLFDALEGRPSDPVVVASPPVLVNGASLAVARLAVSEAAAGVN